MNMDAVIGCDAVDAGNAWLRLTTAMGAVRTIPWETVKIAGMGGNHEGHVTIQGVTERVTPYFATHDSLWIVSTDGSFAQVMLEKASPKRDAILAAFARQLGDRWKGDQLNQSELMEMMFQIPISSGLGIPKIVIFMIAGFLFILLAAVVVLVLGR